MDVRGWFRQTWARWILRQPDTGPGIDVEPPLAVDADLSSTARSRVETREGFAVVRGEIVHHLTARLLRGAEWDSLQTNLEGSQLLAYRVLEAMGPARSRPSTPRVAVVDRLEVKMERHESARPTVVWSAMRVIPVVKEVNRDVSTSETASWRSPTEAALPDQSR